MADDREDLVLSISADTRQILRAMQKLVGDIGSSTKTIEKRWTDLGKGIDSAMNTAVQRRINDMMGIGSKAAKEWTGVLAQQGEEMERLRTRFNPIFGLITRYKSTVTEIQTAHRLGAISANEMSVAIQRERQATLASIAAIKQRNAAIADTPAAGNFNAANIAAQFQDIAITSAMGMSPMQIALQQGTQLAAVLNTMGGARGAIAGLGAAFMQVVNPVSLLTIGTIAATAAAVQYFTSVESGADTSEEALRRQAELIDSVARKWGEVLPQIRAAAAEQERLAGRKDIEDATQLEIEKTFQRIGKEVTESGNAIQTLMDLIERSAPQDQIIAMQQAFMALNMSASQSKTSTEELEAAHRAVLALYKSTKITVFQETADDIARLIPELASVNQHMAELTSAQAAANALQDFETALNGIQSDKARDEIDALARKVKEGEISISDFLDELNRISGYAPDVSRIIGAAKAVASAWSDARRAVLQLTLSGDRAAELDRSLQDPNRPTLMLPGTAPTPDRRVDPYFEDWRKQGGGSKAPKRTADDRFFEDIEAIRQRTMALIEERNMLGMSFEAQAKRKVAFDLETQALKDVREEARRKGEADWQNAQLTPEQVRAIEEVADAYAKQAEALRKAQEALQLRRDVVEGAFDDLRSALADGKLEWEDFANVAMNALDKVIDKIQTELIDAIFAANGAGGGGGFFANLIGLLFGGGSAAGASSAATGSAPAPRPVRVPSTPEFATPVQGPQNSFQFAPSIAIDARGAQPGVGKEIEAAVNRALGAFVNSSAFPRAVAGTFPTIQKLGLAK